MGGVAAIAGALGPTIGGVLTSALSWRFVFLANVPLAVVCVIATQRAVPVDGPRKRKVHLDLLGAGLLFVAIVGLVFGLTETQAESFLSVEVAGSLGLAVVSAALFVRRELRVANPLMDLRHLRRTGNYLGSTLSQGLAGMTTVPGCRPTGRNRADDWRR
jgi:MFS family permease